MTGPIDITVGGYVLILVTHAVKDFHGMLFDYSYSVFSWRRI